MDDFDLNLDLDIEDGAEGDDDFCISFSSDEDDELTISTSQDNKTNKNKKGINLNVALTSPGSFQRANKLSASMPLSSSNELNVPSHNKPKAFTPTPSGRRRPVVQHEEMDPDEKQYHQWKINEAYPYGEVDDLYNTTDTSGEEEGA